MRNVHWIAWLTMVVASAFVTAAHAQHSAEDADHDALRSLKATYERAIVENNPALIEPHLADGFTGVMVTAHEVAGYGDLLRYWQWIRDLMGDGGSYRVEIHVAELATIIGDTALAHGSTDDVVTTAQGTTYRFKSHWTAICRRVDGEWKIHRIHGTMDPLDNPFVNTRLRYAVWTTGIIAALGGLIVGALLYRFIATMRGRSIPAG